MPGVGAATALPGTGPQPVVPAAGGAPTAVGPEGPWVPIAEPVVDGRPRSTTDAGRRDGAIPAPPGDGIAVGPLKLHAYGVALMTGGAVGTYAMRRALVRAGLPTNRLTSILLPAAVAGIVGARLYHVATQWQDYRDHPIDVLKVWEGGLGIYGGVAAGALTGAFLARRAGMHVSPLLDAAAIGLPIAQAIGRSGNYMNQELYGKPTDLPWGLQVDREYRPAEYEDRNSFHPTFLYEAGWNVALAGGLFALSKAWKGRPPGVLFATYVGGYAAGRFLVEGLRIDPSKEAHGLRTNQWTSLAVLGAATVAAGALTLASRGKVRPPL